MSKPKPKAETSIVGPLLKKLAPKLGARVLLEPEWGMVGRITYKSGARSYFRAKGFDLNPLGSAKVASDKDYANFFMRKLGYPVVEGKTFFRKEFAKAINARGRSEHAAAAYAQKLGFPVIVKPNNGSQGSNVFLAHHKKDLDFALARVFKQDHIALVQRLAHGRDYRVVVLDNEVISAYERVPLSVIGDGRSTIAQLLLKKSRQFHAIGRDTQIRGDDPRIARKLAREKLSLRSKPQKGCVVSLLDNANLSTGGDSRDVTDTIHPDFKAFTIKLTKDMGLRFSGVDLLVEGSIEEKPGKFVILEINDTPGLDHYATSGAKQRKIVEDLYFKVLKAMEK